MRLGTWSNGVDSAEFKSNISRIRVWNEPVLELHKVYTAKIRVGDSILLGYLQPEGAHMIAKTICDNSKIRRVIILTQPWNLNELKEPMYSKLLDLDLVAQDAFLSTLETFGSRVEVIWRGTPIRQKLVEARDVTPGPASSVPVEHLVHEVKELSVPPRPSVPAPISAPKQTFEQIQRENSNLKAEIHRLTIENENLRIQLHDAISRMNRFVNGGSSFN